MRKQRGLTRREAFQATGLGALGLMRTGTAAAAESTVRQGLEPNPGIQPLNRLPRMVQEYFVAKVREAEKSNLLAEGTLQTKADAEVYVRSVRDRIALSFGPFPEKTPLNPKITGVVERDTYRIEKVIFESRPGFLVTANLYLPKGRSFPRPGVVGTCGHSTNGKAGETYQAFSQGLARLGYVVLIFDPIGQGERMQYTDEDLQPRRGTGTREHLYAGNQQFLVGEFIGNWRAWDGIRALDYLLTREEVDPNHVGVTGNSGGGTMTTWLCGVEPRWTMAAPSCFVTTFRRNLENELPADTEQCPPRALSLRLDHADFLAAMAPKPIIVLGQEKDYFDARGVEEAYQRLKHLYQLLGAEENIGLFIGPRHHGFHQENREAMYSWFNRVTGISDRSSEPEIVLEEDETLWCTPQGQVAGLDSRPIYLFIREKTETLSNMRPGLEGKELSRAVSDALKLGPEGEHVPDYRILRPESDRGYPTPHAASYLVETEPGIHAAVYRLSEEPLMSRPPRGFRRAVLYVSHHSSDAELREEELIRDLLEVEPEAAFFTCDVRGIGDSRPDTAGRDWDSPYGADYFHAIHSIMLDRPYVGRKTADLLRVLEWLKSSGHEEVHLAAKGWGSIPAAFAALFSETVVQVTLKNAPTSYDEIARSEGYDWPLSSFLPGVLERFDLPDCYRELEKKGLRLIDPWGPEAG